MQISKATRIFKATRTCKAMRTFKAMRVFKAMRICNPQNNADLQSDANLGNNPNQSDANFAGRNAVMKANADLQATQTAKRRDSQSNPNLNPAPS
jgi:hypothetical protein